jgi:hypothetical protein
MTGMGTRRRTCVYKADECQVDDKQTGRNEPDQNEGHWKKMETGASWTLTRTVQTPNNHTESTIVLGTIDHRVNVHSQRSCNSAACGRRILTKRSTGRIRNFAVARKALLLLLLISQVRTEFPGNDEIVHNLGQLAVDAVQIVRWPKNSIRHPRIVTGRARWSYWLGGGTKKQILAFFINKPPPTHKWENGCRDCDVRCVSQRLVVKRSHCCSGQTSCHCGDRHPCAPPSTRAISVWKGNTDYSR